MQVHLRLRVSLPITEVRAIRKLIEVATHDADLLLHDGCIYGIGNLCRAAETPPDEQPLEFQITGRGSWQLQQAGHVLLQVRDGISRLPSAATEMAINEDDLRDRIAWLLPDANVDALTDLARALQGNSHGAMLIISGHAAQEATRFGAQARVVEPAQLTANVAVALTEMDGGILVDDQAQCHAIGVLLDGMTGAREDFARGSRYNNSARYLALDGDPCSSPGATRTIVIVYSSDGMVNVLPPSRPPLQTAVTKQLVEEFTDAVRMPAKDPQRIINAYNSLDRSRFYLMEEQCEQLNASIDAVENWPAAAPKPRRFFRDLRMTPDRFLV